MNSNIEAYASPVFPRLMLHKSEKIIVLFITKDCGVIVHSESTAYRLGYYSDNWNFLEFTQYFGKVILSEP